jgi:hypothetical protein
MKKTLMVIFAIVVLPTLFPCATGCSSADQAMSEKTKEEVRKQHIDRAERMRQETKSTK